MATAAELRIRIRHGWVLSAAVHVASVLPNLGHWLVCKALKIPETQMRQNGRWVTIGHPGDDLICLR